MPETTARLLPEMLGEAWQRRQRRAMQSEQARGASDLKTDLGMLVPAAVVMSTLLTGAVSKKEGLRVAAATSDITGHGTTVVTDRAGTGETTGTVEGGAMIAGINDAKTLESTHLPAAGQFRIPHAEWPVPAGCT